MNNTFYGSCHCGEIKFALHTNKNAEDFIPRCDEKHCRLCWKNNGTWIADQEGKLEILKNSTEKSYIPKNGSGLWRLCFCGNCGTICYGIFEDQGESFAVIRARTMDNMNIDFTKTLETNFDGEEQETGRARRRKNWTPLDEKAVQMVLKDHEEPTLYGDLDNIYK